MTLSMDRFSEIFDFGDITKSASTEHSYDSFSLSHQSDTNILDTQRSNSTFESFSDSVTESQSFSELLEDKTMLDMDLHKQPSRHGPQNTDTELNDFPFDEVLSLDFDIPGTALDNIVESPQPSPDEWSHNSPIEFATSPVDCPLTPEKIARASFDFKKLSYEKLNPIKSPLAADYSGCSSNKPGTPKHLLPPGGVKITRYPMKRQMSEVNSPAEIDQSTALILRLQRELKSAKQEIIRYQRSTEDWKNTAHYALQTAKRIKAQLDSQNKNPLRSDKPGIFSPSFPVQTTSLLFTDSGEVMNRREAYKKRSTSDVTPIQCKIPRLNGHIASRDVALLIKSQNSHENLGENSSRKTNNTLSNSVKLALRAKVCKSTNNDSSSNGVFDIYKEVKELLNEVTAKSPQPQSQCSTDRGRISSLDDSWQQKVPLGRKRSFSNSAISHF